MNRALKVLAFSLCWVLGQGQSALSQTPIRLQEAAGPVVQTAQGNALPLAWAGGMNSPQFSSIDLNQDGQLDLFVFDRSSQKVSTFLAVRTNEAWGYQPAPQYAEAFPKELRYFALLRDFNCDGKPDIFTVSSQGVAVYKNTSTTSSGLTFNLTHPVLLYDANANLVIGSEDLPAIMDLDGDGDLDILAWEWSGGAKLEYFRNDQVEQGLPCGTFKLTRASSWWGQVSRCIGTCNSYAFGTECPSIHHIGGSSVLPLDLNEDGVLDLLSGHDDCPDLASLLNTGTNQQPKITSAGYNFGPDIAGKQFSVFPAAYYLDVTFDGLPDLVVAPNMTSNSHQNVDLKNSVWVYANTGTAAKPRFQNTRQPFLQQQMLEVGEGAAPALGDLTGNTALDLLVGNTAALENGRYAASLTLWQNKGTTQQALFETLDTDYLGFSALNLQSLKPQLLDINADGKIDIAWSAYNPSTAAVEFKYLLNQAAAGQSAQFSLAQAVPVPGLLLFKGDAPYLHDLDGDGTLDVLIGKSSGALTYYRNTGTSTAPTWVLASEALGGISPNVERRRLQVTVADLNRGGQPDLLTTDDSGQLRVYPAFKTHLTGTFPLEENVLWQPLRQEYAKATFGAGMVLTAADLANDGSQLPEVLVGTLAGGIRFLRAITEPLGIEENPSLAPEALQLYPNPAQATTQLITGKAASYTLLNLMGVQVGQGLTKANTAHSISTQGLPSGVYLLRVLWADGQVTSRKLIVRH
ncbi:T9SS type A sorting domain-containing protein [Rufibacter soli]